MQNVPLSFEYQGKNLVGFAVPLGRWSQEKPTAFDIIIDKAFMGTLRINAQGWKMDTEQDPALVDIISRYILTWYEVSSKP